MRIELAAQAARFEPVQLTLETLRAPVKGHGADGSCDRDQRCNDQPDSSQDIPM
jgi:hypothetical protein